MVGRSAPLDGAKAGIGGRQQALEGLGVPREVSGADRGADAVPVRGDTAHRVAEALGEAARVLLARLRSDDRELRIIRNSVSTNGRIGIGWTMPLGSKRIAIEGEDGSYYAPIPEGDEVPPTGTPGNEEAENYFVRLTDGKILGRLKRLEGQVRGVHKMVEEDKYCVDVLTQISAVVAGLRATGLLVLEDHIRGCVIGSDPADQEATLDELMSAIERFNRSVS